MEKINKDVSLAEFYQANQNSYPSKPILETLNNLINDFKVQNPAMFKPVSNVLISVQSIEEALNNLDFNWESKYKNHPFLSFYNKKEPINNLLDFYHINKDYYDSLNIKYSDIISSLVGAWQEFSGDTVQNTGTFYNQALNLERRIIFIKNNDFKDYLTDKNNFDHKLFGDKSANVSLIFIYKNNDPEFTTENLNQLIKSHKEKVYDQR